MAASSKPQPCCAHTYFCTPVIDWLISADAGVIECRIHGWTMKSRFLSEGEKRDVAKAALDFLRSQNPGCSIQVTVEDETDDRGVPRYRATITPSAKANDEAKA
jgi:hypothetical protein